MALDSSNTPSLHRGARSLEGGELDEQRPNEAVNFGAQTAFTFTFAPITLPYPAPSTSQPSDSPKRGPGRPKGSKTKNRNIATKPLIYGPQRLAGRPPIHAGDLAADSQRSAKRKPGRPRKVKGSDGSSLGTRVDSGKFVVPGSNPKSRRLTVPSEGSSTPSGSLPAPNSHATLQTGSGTTAVGLRDLKTPQPVVILVQPGEDSQRSIICDDESDDESDDEWEGEGGEMCLEDKASGAGIGVEDESMGCGEDDGDEPNPDEREPSDADAILQVPSALRARRQPLALWLAKWFAEFLAQAKNRIGGIPRLYYELGTIWFPRKDSLFLMMMNWPPTPELLYGNVQFLLWDPLAMPMVLSIPCPVCKTDLKRHGYISRPRRVVDLNECFYMIGVRYLCPSCRNPKSGLCTVTYSSWDQRILDILGPEVSNMFPALVRWRCAVSKRLFGWLRTCMQSGMGLKQFSDGLRVQHLLTYHELERQYLHYLRRVRPMAKALKHKFKKFPTFNDTSPNGPHGYIPSASFFRNIYDQFMEDHRPAVHQQVSVLTFGAGSLDHSHKLTKHVAPVNHKRPLQGVLSTGNQNGEIRTMHFVTTTGHSQTELALSELLKSLELFGHDPPSVMFTDNILGDRHFLEDVFSNSLRKDVIAIEAYSHLDELTIPEDVEISVLNTPQSINAACLSILDDLPHDCQSKLVVGFDIEWNVDYSANGRIGDMIAESNLPRQLRVLLENPNIMKSGKNSSGDLRSLQEAIHSPLPFQGALDLAKLAKQRCVVYDISKASLSSLCARVLHFRLNKNLSERVSSAWTNPTLTTRQINYAALDAYAALRVYDVLNAVHPPQPFIPNQTPIGTAVILLTPNRAGFIASGRTANPALEFDPGEGNVAVQIIEIIQRSAKLRNHQHRTLGDFGELPFVIFHPISLTVVYDPLPQPPPPPNNELPRTPPSTRPPQPPLGDPSPGRNWTSEDTAWLNAIIEHWVAGHDLDADSAGEGRDLLGVPPDAWPDIIRSRVIKDIFHVMNQFQVPRRHGLRAAFFRALRDAMLIPDPGDASRMSVYLASLTPPKTFNDMRLTKAKWLWKRVKRIVPPPEILGPRVRRVLEAFGSAKDKLMDAPLFNLACWKTAKNVLDMIHNGLISDPPGVPLYSPIGIEKRTGLTVYRCFRGTNLLEGGIHTHLRPHLPTSGASLRHLLATMDDFVLHHNLNVGIYNTTGRRYDSHYYPWITNENEDLKIDLEDILADSPTDPRPPDFVNGNLYKRSSEVPIGVLAIPPDIRDAHSMGAYVPSMPHKEPYGTFAKHQNTRKAILPVHTPTERALFRRFRQQDSNFATTNAKRSTRLWNAYANTHTDVHYKLPEHLLAAESEFKTRDNEKASAAMAAEVHIPLLDDLRDLEKSAGIPPVPQCDPQPQAVPCGMLEVTPTPQNVVPQLLERPPTSRSPQGAHTPLLAQQFGAAGHIPQFSVITTQPASGTAERPRSFMVLPLDGVLMPATSPLPPSTSAPFSRSEILPVQHQGYPQLSNPPSAAPAASELAAKEPGHAALVQTPIPGTLDTAVPTASITWLQAPSRTPTTFPLALAPPPTITTAERTNLALTTGPNTSDPSNPNNQHYPIFSFIPPNPSSFPPSTPSLNRGVAPQVAAAVQQRLSLADQERQAISVQRQGRHCMKCLKDDCGGRQKWQNCERPCHDCRSLTCRGRNSAKKEKTCKEGWRR